jgi:hypothetical protein
MSKTRPRAYTDQELRFSAHRTLHALIAAQNPKAVKTGEMAGFDSGLMIYSMHMLIAMLLDMSPGVRTDGDLRYAADESRKSILAFLKQFQAEFERDGTHALERLATVVVPPEPEAMN